MATNKPSERVLNNPNCMYYLDNEFQQYIIIIVYVGSDLGQFRNPRKR